MHSRRSSSSRDRICVMTADGNRALGNADFDSNHQHDDVRTLRAKHGRQQYPLSAAIALAAQIDWTNFSLPRSDRYGRGERPRAYLHGGQYDLGGAYEDAADTAQLIYSHHSGPATPLAKYNATLLPMPAIKHISVGPPTPDDSRSHMTARSINTSLESLPPTVDASLARLVLAGAALNQTSNRPNASARRRHSERLLARHQASRGLRTPRPTPLLTTGWRRRRVGFWVVEARPKLLAHASRIAHNSPPSAASLQMSDLLHMQRANERKGRREKGVFRSPAKPERILTGAVEAPRSMSRSNFLIGTPGHQQEPRASCERVPIFACQADAIGCFAANSRE
ncbi:hypothetical protein QBC39DRAFT_87383 [Podospora conica]|nr:hypothetical protein QBC39DRAFT_87383 [Schizothecium conicum]